MKISIIIPVYNKAKYLEKLLKELRNQSFSDFECILIDDGSTDGSELICDKVSSVDRRFVVVHMPNGGVSHARNIGLDMARGDYITFVDADDEVAQEYLNNLYKCAWANGADMVLSWMARIHANGEVSHKTFPCKPGLVALNQLLPEFGDLQKQSGIFGWCVAKLIKREIATAVKFDEKLRLAEDFDYYLKIYPHVNQIYMDEKALYYYREEAENSSWLVEDDDIDYSAQLRINIHYRDFLKKENAWTGSNIEIVERKISDYVFFTLFHGSMNTFNLRFLQLQKIFQTNEIRLLPEGMLQKILFLLFQNKCVNGCKFVIMAYRWARQIVKGH